MEYTTYFGIVCALFGLPAAIALFVKGCRDLEKVMPGEIVHQAREAFNLDVSTRSALQFFFQYFDKLYLSSSGRPKFLRCAKFSSLVFISIFFLWIIASWSSLPETLTSIRMSIDKNDDALTPIDLTWILLCIVLTINLIGDYFSIWETRIILSKLQAATTTTRMLALWVLDAAASILVFYVFFHFAQIAMVIPYVVVGAEPISMLYDTASDIYSPSEFFSLLLQLLSFPESLGVIYSFCFLTTLSTTFWAGLAIVIVKAWSILRKVGAFLGAEEYPFSAVTMMAIVVVAVLFTLLFLASRVTAVF